MSDLILLLNQFNGWTDKEEWQTCKVQIYAEMTETDSCSFNIHGNIWIRVQMATMQNGNIHHSKASATQHGKWCWDVSEGPGSRFEFWMFLKRYNQSLL